MKTRILSFVLVLAMLFSCLSLEIFATSGSASEQNTASSSQPATDLTAEKIKEYFEKSDSPFAAKGGYDLTVDELKALFDNGSDIILNTAFTKWSTYANATEETYKFMKTPIKMVQTSKYERIVPGDDGNGNYYLKWNPRLVATKAEDGSYFTDLTKNDDGTYKDSELQGLMAAAQVEIIDGQVYYKIGSDALGGEYWQLSIGDNQINSSTFSSNPHIGEPYTFTFDIAHASGVDTGALLSYFQSYTGKNFTGINTAFNLQILADGTLQVLGMNGSFSYADTAYKFVDDKWAQLSMTHVPAENKVYIYIDGVLITTAQAIKTKNAVTWDATDSVQLNTATDFTLYRIVFGKTVKGISLDDLRIYWGENKEILSNKHKNVEYTHSHDVANNKNILTATCLDEGCGESDTIEIALIDGWNGTHGLSTDALKNLLAADGRTALVLENFDGISNAANGTVTFNDSDLTYVNGVYREDTNGDGSLNSKDDVIIQWVSIAVKEGECYIQRPVATNPKTGEVITHASEYYQTLSDEAKAMITEDGYYSGSISGEYLEYKNSKAGSSLVDDLVAKNSEILGQAYVVTMDFTLLSNSGGNINLIQLRSYTANGYGSLAPVPVSIANNNELQLLIEGSHKTVAKLEVGKTVQLTYCLTPRGLKGERQIDENGYSAGDNNTHHLFIDGELVASGRFYANDSTTMVWERDGYKVSPMSDFAVQFIRLGQWIGKKSSDFLKIDNYKIYTGTLAECEHSFENNPLECDWCAKEIPNQCGICGAAVVGDVSVTAQSATIGEAIAYNVLLKLNKDISKFGENDKIVLDTTADGGTRSVEYKIMDLLPETEGTAKGFYKVSIPLRSIDMTRKINIFFESDGKSMLLGEATLNNYFDKLLENPTSSYVSSLVRATKNYGTYAQLYFEGKNGNPEDLGALPNDSLSEYESVYAQVSAKDLLPYKTVIEGSHRIASIQLVLDSEIKMRVLFEDAANLTICENGKTLTKVKSEFEGYSYVTLTDASPATYNRAHTVVFSDGEAQTTVKVSIYSALYLLLGSEDVELQELAGAMYHLGKSACEYKNYYVDGNAPVAQSWDDDGVLKILCVGNSFSQDAVAWLGNIAYELGYTDVIIGNLYKGGCSISEHVSYIEGDTTDYTYYVQTATKDGGLTEQKAFIGYQAKDAIAGENWDFITLQQESKRTFRPNQFGGLQTLIDYVTAMCPTATLVWHMTWAYQQEYLDSTGYGDTYGVATQMQMYEKIVSTVGEKVLDKEEIKYIIPSGTAIQNARTSYLGEDLTRDGFHLDYGIGRYIVALTYFAVLTGADITELEWAPTGLSKGTDVDAGAYAVAIESVLNALANPYEVTESQYKVAPQE